MAAMVSKKKNAQKSNSPVAVNVPAAKSSESPGKKGVTTMPVSRNTIRNKIANVQTP